MLNWYWRRSLLQPRSDPSGKKHLESLHRPKDPQDPISIPFSSLYFIFQKYLPTRGKNNNMIYTTVCDRNFLTKFKPKPRGLKEITNVEYTIRHCLFLPLSEGWTGRQQSQGKPVTHFGMPSKWFSSLPSCKNYKNTGEERLVVRAFFSQYKFLELSANI